MYPTIYQVLGVARFPRLSSGRAQSIHRRGEFAFVQSPVSLRHRFSRLPGHPRDCGRAPQQALPRSECLRASRPRNHLSRDLARRIKVPRIQTAMRPACDMTSKKTLNARNLEALGAERLAELLIEISRGRPAARRLLRLELAGALGAAALTREVRHRTATIRRSRAVIDSRRRRDLVDDLELCRGAIVDRIAGEDAAEALDLMWQYMRLANPIQNRLHYTDEMIAGAFSASDLGDIASLASPEPNKLAERAFEALTQNAHGQYDGLIGALMPALGHEGLERLKQLTTEYSNTPAVQLPEAHRRTIHWRHRGTDVEAEAAERLRLQTVRSALQDIADAQSDVDAFIGQVDETDRQEPAVAAAIARRLLAAGRPGEALKAVAAAEHDDDGYSTRHRFACEDARIDALEALGRSDDAQAFRWTCFERSLSAPHLRAYLRKLPDFDDIEAEEKALDHVQQSRGPMSALSFRGGSPDCRNAGGLREQGCRFAPTRRRQDYICRAPPDVEREAAVGARRGVPPARRSRRPAPPARLDRGRRYAIGAKRSSPTSRRPHDIPTRHLFGIQQTIRAAPPRSRSA